MNHTTTDPALPEFDPYANILLRIAMVRRRLDKLFSLICKGVLFLLPVLFAVAHVAADGQTSNFVRGWKFDPLYDLISTYTTRSPAGWAMVACMFGIAYVLGFISWHAAKRGPGFLAWFTAVAAGSGMMMMMQVAWYPLKPTRAEFISIQEEANHQPTANSTKAKSNATLDFKAVAQANRMETPKYDASLRAHWLHRQGVVLGQFLILLTIMGSRFLWERRGPDRKYWSWVQWLVLLWIVTALLTRVWQPNFVGLSQRLFYFGFYFGLLVIVREIERHRSASAKDRIGMPNPDGPPTFHEDDVQTSQNTATSETPIA